MKYSVIKTQKAKGKVPQKIYLDNCVWRTENVKFCIFLWQADKQFSTFINQNSNICSICLTVLAIIITNDHSINTKEQELSAWLQNLFLSHRLKWFAFQWLLCTKDLSFAREAVVGCGVAAEQMLGSWAPALLLITWGQTLEVTQLLLSWVPAAWQHPAAAYRTCPCHCWNEATRPKTWDISLWKLESSAGMKMEHRHSLCLTQLATGSKRKEDAFWDMPPFKMLPFAGFCLSLLHFLFVLWWT